MAWLGNIQPRPKGNRRAYKAEDFYKLPKLETSIATPPMDRDMALMARGQMIAWVERKGGTIVRQTNG